MQHWQRLLHEIRITKQKLARLDARIGLPVMPPDGASPGEIAALERELGCPLPPSYRQMLSVHDGVPGLYQGASLLGAHDLARGTFGELARGVIARGELCLVEGKERGLRALLPFGVDPAMETIFAWDLRAPRKDGEPKVLLYSNEIVAQLESFSSLLEFILAMLEADVEERLSALWPSLFRARPPALALSASEMAKAPKAGNSAVFAA
jgi:hypothetical protein